MREYGKVSPLVSLGVKFSDKKLFEHFRFNYSLPFYRANDLVNPLVILLEQTKQSSVTSIVIII